MAVHSITKADYQPEGTLRLKVKGEESGRAYEAMALVPSDPSRATTIASDGAYSPPREEIEEAVQKYLQSLNS